MKTRLYRIFTKKFIVFIFLFIPALGFSWEIVPVGKTETACLNLVFCPLNYRKNNDFSMDFEDIIVRLKKTLPFSEFADRISFYRIDISRDEAKLFFAANQGLPPLKIRQEFLKK